MGIYLPNIAMPKESRLTLQISVDGAVYVVNSCSITAETYTTDAVPVPPHGRLIDADALKNRLEYGENNSIGQAHSYYRFAKSWVDEGRTIIEAEVSE